MKRNHWFVIACALSSALGFAFAAVSTSDFVAHLDRQIHGVHCSFLPGLAAADHSGSSGCHATLMSPYSSVLRDELWGGIPVALPGMAVFAFLFFWCVWLLLQGRANQPRATGFLALGSLVPLLASATMGYLSLFELGAACKLCIGIYASSGVLSAAAVALWLRTRGQAITAQPSAPQGATPLSYSALVSAFALGVGTVALSVGAYAASVPDFTSYVGTCGSLPSASDRSEVTISYGPQQGRPQMLEVMDPLCPSCRSFEERFERTEAQARVDRRLLLFPLDQECNWMIDHSIHPGACSISQAVLCAEDPQPVLTWAFANQREIMAAAEKDPGAAAALAKAQFPSLASCIGNAKTEARLNQSLRFAVKNRLQVLTPQIFVEGVRLCGEDTDLGLSFALSRLIDRVQNQPKVRDDLLPAPRTRSDGDFTVNTAQNPRSRSPKATKAAQQRQSPQPANAHAEFAERGSQPVARAQEQAKRLERDPVSTKAAEVETAPAAPTESAQSPSPDPVEPAAPEPEPDPEASPAPKPEPVEPPRQTAPIESQPESPSEPAPAPVAVPENE